jgi:hypothetical protein
VRFRPLRANARISARHSLALRRTCLLPVVGVDTVVVIVASPRCLVITRGEYATLENIKERPGLTGYEFKAFKDIDSWLFDK